jgi:uncharacterized protein YjiS (DUF1127 family)
MTCGSTHCIPNDFPEPARPWLPGLWSWRILPGGLDRTALGWERQHQRKQLLELDDRLLADIGISTQQAVEGDLEFWWTHLTMPRVDR